MHPLPQDRQAPEHEGMDPQLLRPDRAVRSPDEGKAMSNDRELLESAAKAAGIKVAWREYVKCFCYADSPYYEAWSPLTDDGDALWLAVKLHMSVEISEHEASTYAYAGKVPRTSAWELWRDDPYAATRRAIVRAAAAMGEAA